MNENKSGSSIIELRMLELSNGHNEVNSIITRIFQECNVAQLLVAERVKNSIGRLYEEGYLESKDMNFPKAVPNAGQKYLENYGYPQPAVINWEITSACNLKCPHCYARAGLKKCNELDTETMKGIIDQFAKLQPGAIDFSGGEPMMRKDFFELLAYAGEKIDRKVTKLKILTNGTLVTEENAKILSKYIDFAHISIDGIGKVHDDFRMMEGAFDKAIKAIKLLRKNNIPVCITSTIHEKSIDQVDDVIKLALDLQVERLRFGFFTSAGRGADNYDKNNTITLKKKKEIYEYIASKALELKDIVPIDSRDRFYGLMDHSSELGCDSFTLCRAGTKLLFITSTGDLTPCYMLNEPEFYAGNVKDDTILNIWNNSEIFRKFRDINVSQIEQCSNCKRKDKCGGGMRCGAYGVSKNILGPDPDCIFADNLE